VLKLEIRNPKLETNTKFECLNFPNRHDEQQYMAKLEKCPYVLNFWFWSFGFVLDFDIRISNLRRPYENGSVFY